MASQNLAAHLSEGMHNESVRRCAEWLELATDPDELQLYTSSSLRRGNACTIEAEVQKVRVFGQQHFSWAPGSKVPEQHYTSQRAMFQPRPLVLDVAAVDQKCDAKCNSVQIKKYN